MAGFKKPLLKNIKESRESLNYKNGFVLQYLRILTAEFFTFTSQIDFVNFRKLFCMIRRNLKIR
jgi:hypothetical protein